jgi:RNA polymerase sporulation-specific sigma factor
MVGKVEICGVNTSKLPTLNNTEKIVLFKKVQDGDRVAREEFIKCNLRLVLSVIRKFHNRGEHLDDLFQIGCIGLIKALDNFDVTLNVKFSTYAVPMIIGEIRRHLRDNSSIRVSRSIRDTAYSALSMREKLTIQYSREPTIGEIAKELNLPKEEVILALDAIQEPISLHDSVHNDPNESIEIIDQVRDEKNIDDNWIEKLSIDQALKHLSEREKNILGLRFFEGKTQTEVAEEIGISQAQVSRLEKNALKHMRRSI